jgi:hypothetical protein
VIWIGVDAGKYTGVAVWNSKSRSLSVLTTDFWGCYNFILENYGKSQIRIVIEDPSKTPPVFNKKFVRSEKARLKVAQNVGGVKRESVLLADGLERAGFTVIRTKPNNTKKNSVYIKRLTGYEGRTNEHNRDAIMLVYGRA